MSFTQFIPFTYKIRTLLFLQKFKPFEYFKNKNISTTDKKVIVFLAANYSNLGDVAITYAQKKFIAKNVPEAKVIPIPISETLEGIVWAKSILNSSDIITTVGGGNFGDLYDQIETLRQLIVSNFPKNKIVSFPQTFDFSNSEKGRKALAIAQKCYSKHTKLSFFLREQKSFGLMQKAFPEVKSLLTPDIVLSLNQSEPQLERKGVTISLRKDDEKLLGKEQENQLLDYIANKFSEVTFYDTHLNKGNLSKEECDLELDKIWHQYKTSELVITDRLHGMIFSYITNTPCIVFLNNNHKIEESFHWIKEFAPTILLREFSISIFENALQNIFTTFKHRKYQSLENQFQSLKEQLAN